MMLPWKWQSGYTICATLIPAINACIHSCRFNRKWPCYSKEKVSALRLQRCTFFYLLLASSNDVDGLGLIYSGFEKSSGDTVIITVKVFKLTFFFYLVAMLSGLNHKIHLLHGATSYFSQFKNIHLFIHFLLFIQFRDAVRLEPRVYLLTGLTSLSLGWKNSNTCF